MQAIDIEITDFIDAIRKGDEEKVQRMIVQGADVNAIDLPAAPTPSTGSRTARTPSARP